MYVTRFSVGTDRCMPRSGTANVSLKLHRVERRQMTLSAVNTNGRWCDGLMMKMMMVMREREREYLLSHINTFTMHAVTGTVQ